MKKIAYIFSCVVLILLLLFCVIGSIVTPGTAKIVAIVGCFFAAIGLFACYKGLNQIKRENTSTAQLLSRRKNIKSQNQMQTNTSSQVEFKSEDNRISSTSTTTITEYSKRDIKNGHPLKYSYIFQGVPVDGISIKNDILQNSEKEIDVAQYNDKIELSYNGTIFGYIDNAQKAAMLSDWKKRQLPYEAILLKDCTINLRFYRDMRIGNDFREQTVTSLINYKRQNVQETLLFMDNDGKELTIDEDEKGYYIDDLGRFNKQISERFMNEEPYGVFFEEAVEDDNGYLKPYVRIYW